MPGLGTTDNWLSGTITGIVGTATALTRVNVANIVATHFGQTSLGDDSADLDNGPATPGRFEKGTLNIGPPVSPTVIAPVIGNGDFFVEVATAAAPANMAGLAFFAEDSDQVTAPETMMGTVTQITPGGGGFILTLSVATMDPPWGNMVGGHIQVGGGEWVEVIAENSAASTVTVAALSIPFSIHDDDVDALLPYSAVALDPMYQVAYQDAYIEPVVLSGADSELISWQLNVLPDQISTFPESEFDPHRADEFWVAYSMWMFQFHEQKDYDAGSEMSTGGFGSGRGWTSDGKWSAIAVETTRDSFAVQPTVYQGFGYQSYTDLLWRTFAHEVGHQFKLDHANGQLMGAAEAQASTRFHPDDLAQIRGNSQSPGRR